mmetsp:Transcript_20123/g.50764  ORF Transcript_20123/g.50764 Transcript_20123/m.50764 type:complete len:246 (+) Transcript_20123:2955-3692(+)
MYSVSVTSVAPVAPAIRFSCTWSAFCSFHSPRSISACVAPVARVLAILPLVCIWSAVGTTIAYGRGSSGVLRGGRSASAAVSIAMDTDMATTDICFTRTVSPAIAIFLQAGNWFDSRFDKKGGIAVVVADVVVSGGTVVICSEEEVAEPSPLAPVVPSPEDETPLDRAPASASAAETSRSPPAPPMSEFINASRSRSEDPSDGAPVVVVSDDTTLLLSTLTARLNCRAGCEISASTSGALIHCPS